MRAGGCADRSGPGNPQSHRAIDVEDRAGHPLCARQIFDRFRDVVRGAYVRQCLRAQQGNLTRRGYDLSPLRARQLGPADCRRFDYVLVMDRGNLNRTRSACGGLAPNVRLLMDFAPNRPEREVPDPYAGGPEGFEHVLDLIEEACRGLLEDVKRRLAGQDARAV